MGEGATITQAIRDAAAAARGPARARLGFGGGPATYRCPLCGCSSRGLHRVRAATRGPWLLACSPCSARLAHGGEGFAYGGRVSGRGVVRKPA